MKRSVVFIGLLFMVLFSSGCVGSSERLVYVCPSGESVNDPTLCALPSTTSSTVVLPAPVATTLPPITLAPTTSAPVTPAPMTAAPSTTTTSIAILTPSSTTTTSTVPLPPEKPVLEIVDVSLMQGPGGEFWIGGKVRNNGLVEVFFVQTRLTLFDRFGKELRVLNSAPIDKIDPGATVEFNTIKSIFPSENVADYSLTVYAGE